MNTSSAGPMLIFALVVLVAAVLYAPKLAGLFLILLAGYYVVALGAKGIISKSNVPTT